MKVYIGVLLWSKYRKNPEMKPKDQNYMVFREMKDKM